MAIRLFLRVNDFRSDGFRLKIQFFRGIQESEVSSQ